MSFLTICRPLDRSTFFVLVAFGILSSFSNVASRADAKPKVVATISIIGDWAREVGGDDIELSTLVGPDGDPHEYEPVPADSIKLGEANVILENGFGLESWLPKLAESAQTHAEQVVITDGVKARRAPESDGDAVYGKEVDRDPHAWQNVENAIIMVDNIRDALDKVDPGHADAYKSRTEAYDRKLESLDAEIASEMNSIPKSHRKLVTSHDAFGYFGQRYGVDISHNVLESITTEAADPSAKQIAAVVEQIKSFGVPVIFLEYSQNPKLISEIASEANVKVGPPLYSDALGKPGTDGDTYLKMMKYNADTLVHSLKS